MKIKVIKKSFYNKKVNKIGDIIDIDGEKVPSWGVKVSDEKAPEASNKKETNDLNLEELSKKSDDEIKEIIDNLLNEAIDKGIMIDFENKSDIELIIELQDLLEGKE